MRRCTRCVLTENHAQISFDDKGVCNYCLEFDKAAQQPQSAGDRENEFVQLVEKHRGRGDYDCLMMLSGGKDSTYALYLLKERYRLNVLGFTFDNGFESDAALENVRRAVDALNVTHLYFRPIHIKRLFRFLLHNGVKPFALCPLCKSAMNTTAWEIAKKFNIGLIVLGNTTGQQTPRPLHPDTYTFVRKAADLIGRESEFRPRFVTYFNRDLFGSEKMQKDNVRLVSPYHYLDWDPKKAVEVLAHELGWKPPTADYPRGATNCLINLVGAYASRLEYGFSFYDTEMSTLIRRGEITREEALQALEVDIDPQAVAAILARLGLSLDDLARTGPQS